jgi:hypothetical protein
MMMISLFVQNAVHRWLQKLKPCFARIAERKLKAM